MITIRDYQDYVMDGASPNYDRRLAMLGLMGEVGELADVIKKEAIYNDMSKFESKYGMSVKDKIADEAGDVLWQYMLVISKYGLDINEVIEKNVAKLNARHDGPNKTAQDGGGQR